MLQHQDISLIRQIDLFGGLPQADLEKVARAAVARQYREGEFLFHQGDPARHMHVLVEGRIKLVQYTPDGQQVIIRYLGPGETFAVLAVLRNTNYPVAAQVVVDCTVLSWERATMKQLMNEFPPLEQNALSIMADRVREFQDRIRELSTERVERRIARTLLRLVRQTGRRVDEGILIELPLTRQDLAEMAGTTLYTVSRTLRAWEARGVVRCGRIKVTVTNPHQLVQIAEDLPDGRSTFLE